MKPGRWMSRFPGRLSGVCVSLSTEASDILRVGTDADGVDCNVLCCMDNDFEL
jgi:hypothetical protein